MSQLKTQALWEKQDQHKGDRWRLFQAIGAVLPASKVLYAGSYVDIAPSFVFKDVTYADMDKRAAQFFADIHGVREIIAAHGGSADTKFEFIHGDVYKAELEDQSFDLLISLYAGFISEACGNLLRIGGTLLVNSSHGDAALAALDPRLELTGVVVSLKKGYNVSRNDLEDYMVPKKPQTITREMVKNSGRGIAYTKSPFAYLFERVHSPRTLCDGLAASSPDSTKPPHTRMRPEPREFG